MAITVRGKFLTNFVFVFIEINVLQNISRNGYPKHWSDRGILTDGPDFTYSNGKITPYTNGQRARLLEQKQYAVI